MGILWITTIGMILCLGMVGGILFFSIRSAVDPKDATRIDGNDRNDSPIDPGNG